MNAQFIAGMVSSMIFVSSNLPMLYKALKTKDLKSYSIGNIALSNLGNFVYWFYIASLPFGPVWFLHGFNTLTTTLMLIWYLRYEMRTALSPFPRCVDGASRCFGAS